MFNLSWKQNLPSFMQTDVKLLLMNRQKHQAARKTASTN